MLLNRMSNYTINSLGRVIIFFLFFVYMKPCSFCLPIIIHYSYKSHIQVLATSTKLLTNPNKTWKQACQLDFELDRSILPSVANPRLGVEHSIRITVEFCNTNSDCCSNNMDLQFPVVFTGGAFSSQEREQEITVDASVTRALSISSCSSFGELSNHDSAIDIPSSFKSISNYLHSYKLQV